MYGRDRYPELFELVEEMHELANRKNLDLEFLTEMTLLLRQLLESVDTKRRIARKPRTKQ